MALYPFYAYTVDAQGDITTGTAVEVRDAAGDLATLYNQDGTSLTNPFTSGGTNADVLFYAEQGTYAVTTGSGASEQTVTVQLGPVVLANAAAVVADESLAYSPTGNQRPVIAGNVIRTDAEGFAYEVAASGASDHHLTTAGGVKLNVLASNGAVSLAALGVDDTGAASVSEAITNLLAQIETVIVPPGTYSITDTVIVPEKRQIILEQDAVLKRFSAQSSATTPLIDLNQTGGILRGAGPQWSRVVTENRSPDGIVKVGHDSVTDSSSDISRCTVRDIMCLGPQDHGFTSGDFSVGLKLISAQLNSTPSYRHFISNVHMISLDYGFWGVGTTNALNVTQCQTKDVGNSSRGAGLFLQGPQDCVFQGWFHESTANSRFMLIDDVNDGVANRQCAANVLSGMTAEISGASSRWLEVVPGSFGGRNIIEGVDNVEGGISVPSDFYDNNIIRRSQEASAIRLRFPETPNYSSDADVLDAYRKGASFPSLPVIDSATPGTGRVTSADSATFTLVGDVCFFDMRVRLTTLGSGGSGQLVVNNLPFVADDTVSYRAGCQVTYFDGLGSNVAFITGLIDNNTSAIRLFGTTGAATSMSSLAFSTFAATNMELRLSGHYKVKRS